MIVEAGDYRVVMYGGRPSCRAHILWRTDDSMITPNGIAYVLEENEFDVPSDMPKLVSDYKREFPDYQVPVQR